MRHQKIALIVALLVTVACGARQKAVTAAYVSLKASETAFVEWDKYHQTDIVEHATSAAEGHEKLVAYRSKRQEVLMAFSVAWSALTAASLYDGDGWLKAAVEAASQVYLLVKELEHG